MTAVELARELVRTPSVTGDEHDLCHQVADRLEGKGFEVELQPVDGFGPNVVCRNRPFDPDRPTVLLNGHLDTVPVQGVWTKNPFEAEVDRSAKRLYGLGACDMKGGDACIVDAFERVARDVAMNLWLVLTTDEEGQCAGAYRAVEHLADRGVRPDVVLIPERTDEAVCLGARGRAAFDVEVKGEAGHGARPDRAVNAVEEAARVVRALPELPLADHALLPPSTATPLRVRAGNYSLSVPDRCTLTLDRHLVPPETAKQARADLVELLDGVGLKVGYDLRFIDRPTPFLDPYVLTGNEPPVAHLLRTYEEHFHAEPAVTYAHSPGDYNVFARVAPTVVLGPTGDNLHRGDEWVGTESLLRVAGFVAAWLRAYDEAAPAPAPASA